MTCRFFVTRQSNTNVTFRSTRYKTTLLFSTTTCCSFTQADLMAWTVLDALAIPWTMASSKLLGDSELISIILATDMELLLLFVRTQRSARGETFSDRLSSKVDARTRSVDRATLRQYLKGN